MTNLTKVVLVAFAITTVVCSIGGFIAFQQFSPTRDSEIAEREYVALQKAGWPVTEDEYSKWREVKPEENAAPELAQALPPLYRKIKQQGLPVLSPNFDVEAPANLAATIQQAKALEPELQALEKALEKPRFWREWPYASFPEDRDGFYVDVDLVARYLSNQMILSTRAKNPGHARRFARVMIRLTNPFSNPRDSVEGELSSATIRSLQVAINETMDLEGQWVEELVALRPPRGRSSARDYVRNEAFIILREARNGRSFIPTQIAEKTEIRQREGLPSNPISKAVLGPMLECLRKLDEILEAHEQGISAKEVFDRIARLRTSSTKTTLYREHIPRWFDRWEAEVDRSLYDATTRAILSTLGRAVQEAKRSGNFPAKLTNLPHDPMKPTHKIQYERTNGGCKVWSVLFDGVDQRGEVFGDPTKVEAPGDFVYTY